MKKNQFFATALLLTITLFCSGNLSAQWSQSATAIYPTTLTKNVGIGTSTPTNAKLQFGNVTGNKITLFDNGGGAAYGFGINGYNLCAYIPGAAGYRFSIRANDYNGVEKFIVNSNGTVGVGSRIFPGLTGTEGGGWSLVHFKNGTTTTGGIIRASIGNTDTGGAPLRTESSSFDIFTNNTKRMSITNAGNVVMNNKVFAGNSTNNGTYDLGFGGEGTGEGIGRKGTPGGNLWGLDFYTNNINRMSITNAGKVLARKQLNVGTENLNNGTIDLAFGAEESGEGIGCKRTTGGNQWGLDFYTNNINRMSITNAGKVLARKQFNVGTENLNNGTIDLAFGADGSGEGIGCKRTLGGNQYGLDFYTASSNRMTISNVGKVGIGITLTSEMPGNYKLYVADGIMTEKVKVALKNTSDWADYVFAADYRLRSLDEVETYVRENKHLPGVPSAEEVQKTGIDVATMDAKLLEKIEELTLYMIDIKKENDALKARINTLESAKK